MATSSHIRSRSARRLALLVLVPLALLAAGLSPVGASAATSYNWPVKPFDRAHPVRANFGDPRTTFAGPATPATLMTGGGTFAFHFGIDISVPDGTAVYSVSSGVVNLIGARDVAVRAGGFVT